MGKKVEENREWYNMIYLVVSFWIATVSIGELGLPPMAPTGPGASQCRMPPWRLWEIWRGEAVTWKGWPLWNLRSWDCGAQFFRLDRIFGVQIWGFCFYLIYLFLSLAHLFFWWLDRSGGGRSLWICLNGGLLQDDARLFHAAEVLTIHDGIPISWKTNQYKRIIL